MYAFEDHYAHRDSPEDVDGYVTLRNIAIDILRAVDGYVTLRKIYWLIAHNIFRLKVNLIQDKYNQ